MVISSVIRRGSIYSLADHESDEDCNRPSTANPKISWRTVRSSHSTCEKVASSHVPIARRKLFYDIALQYIGLLLHLDSPVLLAPTPILLIAIENAMMEVLLNRNLSIRSEIESREHH